VTWRWSVPQPDVAVLAGDEKDLVRRHPSTALLVVEVAVTTVAQDRLTKARIYAAAGVSNYWIVSPAEACFLRCCADPAACPLVAARLESAPLR